MEAPVPANIFAHCWLLTAANFLFLWRLLTLPVAVLLACVTSLGVARLRNPVISGAAVAASTHKFVDRSSVRLSRGRVTTRDVGPLAVGSGDRRPAGGTAVCSPDTCTLTGDSTSSSSSAVLATSTLGSLALCAAVDTTRTQLSQLPRHFYSWLVHWPLIGAVLHLVQRGGAWAGDSSPRPLLAVPNVTAHPSTASVPTSYYSMWH